ncbi:restriction endonuclease subunit S [Streptomyces sp. NPDC057555]|uniref:restriction endonuclease subunit S n=1 Tax=Streptomyces sp. NPDC057555 TaxID=3346166 RepID=UPI0036892FDE
MGGLPEGWAWARLGDLGSEVRETVVPSEGNVYELWSVPSFASGSPEVLDGREIGSAKLSVEPGDVLICKINPRINRVWSVAGRKEGLIQVCSPEWVVLRLHGGSTGVSGKYLQYYLSSPSFRQWISSSVSGVTGSHTRAKSKDILARQVPVPPLAEQYRIVEALEEQFSRLDAAKEGAGRSLKRIDVLSSTLLTSALASTVKFAKLKDVLASPLINGRSVKTLEGGFPILRLTAIKNGRLDLAEFKAGAWDSEDAKPYLVEKGDFLISRGNGSLKLVGRGGLAGEVKEGVAFPDTMIRVRVDPDIANPEFLSLIWGAGIVRRQIESSARTTAGIYKVNQQILESIEFPLPSLEEQLAIVRRREVEIDYLAAVRAAAESVLQRSHSLGTAMLRNAFTGKLLPQDPANEPAATLLARIAAERDAAKPARKAKRAARPRKVTAPAKATEAAPAPTPAPLTTVQQELFQ